MDKNRHLIELSESERTGFGRVEFSVQSEPQKVFSAIWQLESLVNNDSFDGYFRFSDSNLIQYAPVALSAIGALACADIVERAIQLVSPLPPTQEGRHSALDAIGDHGQEQLQLLDSEFYSYPDNLTDLLFEFVRDRTDVFGPLPC
jgi:hypothetical protein